MRGRFGRVGPAGLTLEEVPCPLYLLVSTLYICTALTLPYPGSVASAILEKDSEQRNDPSRAPHQSERVGTGPAQI